MSPWYVAGPIVVIISAVIYWLLVTTEGTYLGYGLVTRLYDWSAVKYNGIKQVRFVDEVQHIGIPLAHRLRNVDAPVIVDVATGTGRVPLAVLPQLPSATVIGLDGSIDMMRIAQQECEDWDRCTFAQADARHLPVVTKGVDALTCLEALEFMPDPDLVLAEMWRVLKPGGILYCSNRVGFEARFFPGRVARRGELERLLTEIGFVEVSMRRWQVHYDLIWARKPFI